MKIELVTNNPLAIDSPDHLMPQGTRIDNTTYPFFNRKLEDIYPEKLLRVLDLGCAGGGFVHSMLNDGHIGVGLEGSDWSLKMRRAEWATIPEYLFTCDITKPFQLKEDGKPMKFDVITCWEVIEHLRPEQIPILVDNIRKHLLQQGIFVASINLDSCLVNGVELHQSVKTEEEWLKIFKELELFPIPKLKKFIRHFVRNINSSFHLVASFSPDRAPKAPMQTLRQKLFDAWVGSKTQKRLSRIVNGYHSIKD